MADERNNGDSPIESGDFVTLSPEAIADLRDRYGVEMRVRARRGPLNRVLESSATHAYDRDHYDRDEYDRDHYDRKHPGYDRDEYDREHPHYDRDHYDRDEYDRDHYDRNHTA